MSGWTATELDKIGQAEELQIAPERPDGSLPPYLPIWVVRDGDDLYVRSYRGPRGKWYRTAHDQRQGRIKAGGVERDVSFADAPDDSQDAISQAYETKYARFGRAYLDPMTAPDVAGTTLRLVPR
jgi:hypothetical protein